jgi:hypothetical protein
MLQCENIALLAMKFLDVAKVSILLSLSLLILCKLSFPIVGLKMSSLPTSAVKSPKKIFVWYLGGFIEYMFQFLIEVVFDINYILCFSMNIQNNSMKQAT